MAAGISYFENLGLLPDNGRHGRTSRMNDRLKKNNRIKSTTPQTAAPHIHGTRKRFSDVTPQNKPGPFQTPTKNSDHIPLHPLWYTWKNVSMIPQFISSLFFGFYSFFAQMLRRLISSPRNRHSDPLSSTSLDLAYLTPNLIVMSTPASSFPTTLWRNPAEDVRRFLDANHPDMWRVWSLRGEGSDYLDKDLDGKGIEHHVLRGVDGSGTFWMA